ESYYKVMYRALLIHQLAAPSTLDVLKQWIYAVRLDHHFKKLKINILLPVIFTTVMNIKINNNKFLRGKKLNEKSFVLVSDDLHDVIFSSMWGFRFRQKG